MFWAKLEHNVVFSRSYSPPPEKAGLTTGIPFPLITRLSFTLPGFSLFFKKKVVSCDDHSLVPDNAD